MRKLAMSILFCLSIFVLASCNQSGLEKISFKEAEKKIEDTKGEYVAFVDVEDNTSEEYKKLLKKVSENNKIYYVDITDEIATSDYYQKKFTAKYPNTKDGIFITNEGKKIDDNKVFEFPIETNISAYENSKYDFEEAVKAANEFLNDKG